MPSDDIVEPPNSTVHDWMGQEVPKDEKIADEALEEAGGDMTKAETLFNQRSHINDPEVVPAVPADERPK
jgi:hypothetical protein